MKKLFFSTIFLIAAFIMILFVTAPAFAELAASTASPSTQEEYEWNNMTPGSSKTYLGTRLKGPLQTGTTTAAAGSTYIGSNNISTTITTQAYIKTTGNAFGESIALQNGFQNQSITFVLATDGGKDFYVTPATKTGFTSLQLNDAKDSATLKYIDSTTGWVIVGNNGVTVN